MGVVILRGDPDLHATGVHAYAAGSALAERIAGVPGGIRTGTEFVVLLSQVDDVDFVEGFYDTLDPADLARVLSRIADPAPADPQATGTGVNPADPEVGTAATPETDRSTAEEALGASLAVYSRNHGIDEEWLGGFNTCGLRQTMESGLLASLLPRGRFDADLLWRLAEQYYGRFSEVDDIGLASDHQAAAGGGGKYEAALLRAIADDPLLVCRFAWRHVADFLDQSTLRGSDALFQDMIPDEVEEARVHLLARAGDAAVAAYRADPQAAEAFLTRVLEIIQARDVPPGDVRSNDARSSEARERGEGRDGGADASDRMRAALLRIAATRMNDQRTSIR